MNTLRRIAVLVPLTAGAISGASLPAWAAFSDTAKVGTTITTASVAAPSSVTVTGRCQGWRFQFDVSWPASTTPRGVTGYRVLAYYNNGTTSVLANTNAATRSVSMTIDKSDLFLQPRIAVTTLTSYRWTAASAKSAVLAC